MGLIAWWSATSALATEAPCLRLAGLVQDYATHQPLAATFFLMTPDGKVRVTTSAEGSGLFSLDVRCPATALLIERNGYRTQSLPLSPELLGGAGRTSAPVAILIPLVAVDRQASNRPYQQSEQTFYEQQAGRTKSGSRPQRGTFAILDALTGTPLRAQTCFFSTNSGSKRCFETNAQGQFETRFEQQDIVAMEIVAPGYQPYHGNLIVERLDGRHLRHDIRLLRQLTLLALYVDGPAAECVLSADGGATVVTLTPVPGQTGWYCAYDVLPQRYELRVRTTDGRAHQEPVTLLPGLNPRRVSFGKTTAVPPAAPKAVLSSDSTRTTPVSSATPALPVLPDEWQLVYFSQKSYLLDETNKNRLRQVGSFLREHPACRLKLVGHTDREGDERLNRILSEQRAEVIANFLHWEGIPRWRLIEAGQGSRYAVAPSDTKENKDRNRRVYLQLEPLP